MQTSICAGRVFGGDFQGLNGFYPKPRAGLGKSAQPLRCLPILIEQIGSQSNHGSGIVTTPTHPSLLHAAIDDEGDGTLNHATAHRIALFSPLLIGADPFPLIFQIGDGAMDSLHQILWQSLCYIAKSLHSLIHATMPEPVAIQVALILPLSLRELLGAKDCSQSSPNLPPEMSPIQNTGRLGKVQLLLGFDPLSPIGDERLGLLWVLFHTVCGMSGKQAKFF